MGDQRDVITQALPDQGRGHREHLAHAGAAGGPFEADHHDVAGLDRAALYGIERRFLGIEDACRPFEVLAAVAGKLDDAALRGEVSVKDRVAAAWLDRIRNRPHHVLRRSEEHTSELQSLMRISYAVFCLKKKNKQMAQIHKLQT